MIGISPVETDDIEVVVFDPDSPRKQTFAAFFDGLDIDHDAARFAKKLASHKREVIVIFLEVGIEHRHLCEALRQELVRQSIGDGIHNVMHEPLALPLALCIADTTIQVKPPQEILITGRLDVVIAVLMKILNISFGEWVHTLHGHDEPGFALYHSVDGLVEGQSRRRFRVIGRNSCCRGYKQQENDRSETAHNAPHEISSKMMWI